jgi:hypothetical protein
VTGRATSDLEIVEHLLRQPFRIGWRLHHQRRMIMKAGLTGHPAPARSLRDAYFADQTSGEICDDHGWSCAMRKGDDEIGRYVRLLSRILILFAVMFR